ncbi:HGGxSTG domain-containing protein [Simiduia sp. 21SJ11W-1]|uniref:HGGxSTG domain-containing protein n=1 Tax=Simiduia sp. 21SJ11W-1 TaxID=2909669 RepID=UPI0035318F4E
MGNTLTEQQRRVLLRQYFQQQRASWLRWWNEGQRNGPKPTVAFPDACRGLRCGAKTRAGTPCKNSGTDYPNGRCRFHGGPSTGPRTSEGKARASRNSQLETSNE